MAKTSKRQSKSRGKTMRRKRGGQKGGVDAPHIIMLTTMIIIAIFTSLTTDRTNVNTDGLPLLNRNSIAAMQSKFVESGNGNGLVFKLTDEEHKKLPDDLQSYFKKNSNSNVWISNFETNCKTLDKIAQIFNQFAANVECNI